MAPRPRFDKLEPERQQDILLAAAAEFSANGYDKASLNAILGAVGVSKGAFYYYFDDKADLFVTVLRQTTESLFAKVELDLDALTADSFWPTLEGLAWQLLELAEEEPHLIGMGKAMYRLPGVLHSEGPLGELLAETGQFLHRVGRRGQELGAVRTDLPIGLLVELALAVDTVFDRWVVEHWVVEGGDVEGPGDGDDLEARAEVARVMQTFFQIQRRMLMPPEAEVGRS